MLWFCPDILFTLVYQFALAMGNDMKIELGLPLKIVNFSLSGLAAATSSALFPLALSDFQGSRSHIHCVHWGHWRETNPLAQQTPLISFACTAQSVIAYSSWVKRCSLSTRRLLAASCPVAMDASFEYLPLPQYTLLLKNDSPLFLLWKNMIHEYRF